MTRSKIDVFGKIFEEIRHRYSPTSIVKGASDNEAIFKYFNDGRFKNLKKWDSLYNQNMNIIIPKLSEKFDAIYPGVVDSHIFMQPEFQKYSQSVLGFDIMNDEGKEIVHNILDAVREKELKLCVVGYGGAMINFLYDVYLLSYLSNYNKRIFKEIAVFERDNLSFTNLLRIGKPVALNSYVPALLTEEGRLNKLNLLREEFQLAEKFSIYEEYLVPCDGLDKLIEEDFVFIGAPNFEARVMLENNNFFFFGHGNNEIEIFFRPHINTDLAIETYGRIDIPVLLSNIAVGTISMLQLFSTVQKVDGKNHFDFENGASVFRVDYGVDFLGHAPENESEVEPPVCDAATGNCDA